MRTIVDTSVWVQYFKSQTDIAEKIDQGLLSGTVYMVGPVVAELLQGARTEKDYNVLYNSIDGVPFIETSFSDWRLAGELFFRLREKGVTLPLTDCLIAAISINNDALVHTLDQHFRQIPGINLV
jgi:predicted nucleic acid-binding protein